ncbi:MAG: hypothetical protein A2Y33_09350 [Spirochaetes bacterium GWF1_51_8]|nr:MAG: hypothetical protein A2Y33_09350 [Spirochaetes bacterium GWF1_51_8]
MKASILTIGNELLDGRIVDTNSTYIERELLGAGVITAAKLAVRDGIPEIKEALAFLAERSEVLVITGGLGPTVDDLTREAVAEFLGRKIGFDEQVYEQVKVFFTRIGRTPPEGNRRQAFVIEGSEVLKNPKGTAPGFYIDTTWNGRPLRIASFPGVPSELKGMLGFLTGKLRAEQSVPEWGPTVYARTMGLPEGLLNDKVKEILPPGVGFGTIAMMGLVDLRFDFADLSVAPETAHAAIRELMEASPFIRRKVYSYDPDITLARAVVDGMRAQGKTLVTAESCTGGMIAAAVTDIAGSSEVYYGGVNVYSDMLKEKLLGVPGETIKEYGAVSFETAFAMLEGLKKISDSDYRIAVTGIAGPSGGSEAKPVGTVYIGFGDRNGGFVMRFLFPGDRPWIRTNSVSKSLEIVYDALTYGRADIERFGAKEVRASNGG